LTSYYKKVYKVFWAFLGLLSLSLGALGIFVPGLPTTPFLLLAAGLFAHSSERLHRFLINNRLLGPYIKKFREEKGLTLRTKIHSIILLWGMVSLSVLFMIDVFWVKIVVIIAGLTGTTIMGFVLKTVK